MGMANTKLPVKPVDRPASDVGYFVKFGPQWALAAMFIDRFGPNCTGLAKLVTAVVGLAGAVTTGVFMLWKCGFFVL